MENIEATRKDLLDKMEYVEKLILEIEELKTEWEKRIAEAEQSKNNFEELIKYVKTEYLKE